jgi:hypothetical protein
MRNKHVGLEELHGDELELYGTERIFFVFVNRLLKDIVIGERVPLKTILMIPVVFLQGLK